MTSGYFDLRGVVDKLPLPSSLAGRRCLDAAACEGFWSFELARRGAAEVVSLDLPDTSRQDWQGLPSEEVRRAGTGLANQHFRLAARRARAQSTSSAWTSTCTTPTRLVLGRFDYVFVGNVLIHLADPARALRALRRLIRPGRRTAVAGGHLAGPDTAQPPPAGGAAVGLGRPAALVDTEPGRPPSPPARRRLRGPGSGRPAVSAVRRAAAARGRSGRRAACANWSSGGSCAALGPPSGWVRARPLPHSD